MPLPPNAIATTEPQPSKSLSQPHELVIQDAVPADADAIAKIAAATFALNFGHSMPAEHMQAFFAEAYTPTAISKELADKPRSQFFVARPKPARGTEDDGKVVGFIQMKLGTTEPCIPPGVPVCEINRIYVSVDHLGGGTGRLLMERGLQWARDQLLGLKRRLDDGAVGVIDDGGVKEHRAGVWLGVWNENVKAERFYRRWGFKRVGEHDFVIGDTKQTDTVMIKWL